jgi:putative mycofactocin binding protein MftB
MVGVTEVKAIFNADAAWDLHSSVSVRPERFGALLYDFRTRRLTFVKDPVLQKVIDALAKSSSAREALSLVKVPQEDCERYLSALARLAETSMLMPRSQGDEK